MSEEQPPLKRIRLSEESLMEMKREDLVHQWKRQEDYISFLESKASHPSDDDSDEKLRQMHSEFTRKEKIQILRLSTKEQEFQELANKLAEISKGQSPGASQLRTTLLDPALNLLFQRMKKELEDKNKQLQQAQEDMSAWKFTSDSQTGKRLMARCRTLLQENQDLGKQVSSGKIANLDAELAMQKKYNEELKGSQDELYEMVVQLNEEGEGMQSTICALQQQLKDVTRKLSKYEVVDPSAAATQKDSVRAINEAMQNTESTENPLMDERTDNGQEARDSAPLERDIDNKGGDHSMVSASEEDPLNSLEEISKEPQGECKTANPAAGHENDRKRTPTTSPSNSDAGRPARETRTSRKGSKEQYAKPQDEVHPLRTTKGHIDDRTSPMMAENEEELKEERMKITIKNDDGDDKKTTKSLATEEMQLECEENRTTLKGDDDVERTPPTMVKRCLEAQPQPCEEESGVTEGSSPEGKTLTSGKRDHAGLDFRTTNVITPDSPPDQSAAGDVEMAEPIRDHLEDKDRTESAVLDDRMKIRTGEEDPLEKMEVIGKDEKYLNQNIEKDLKNVIDESMEEDKPAENVESNTKLNCGENLRDDKKLQSENSNDDGKNVDSVGNEELGESNCLEEKYTHCVASNPMSPENNGEVISTPMSPQTTDDESEPSNVGRTANPDSERCQLPPQSEAVSNLIKTTNGVQKGIVSKDSTALPTVHSPDKDVNCTSNAQSKERTNGPTGQDEGGVLVRTNSPEGSADFTAE